jgi:hypothetical protein
MPSCKEQTDNPFHDHKNNDYIDYIA